MKALDVHGFGGGFTLGTVQAGWDLTAKMSRAAGFGVYATLANRHLLGENWHSYASEPDSWEVMKGVDMVFGNPPCSGFSGLSNKAFRGMNSKANAYMWELINYAGKVAPPMVIWESVQTTFRQGLPLLRQLRDHLEELSGHKYTLYHVLHNNLSHGGVSLRKRYFFVASRVPFGVDKGRITRTGEFAELDNVPTFGDMLLDLAPLGLTMAPQPLRSVQRIGDDRVRVLNSSLWAQREMHDGSGIIDGHDVVHSKGNDRVLEMFNYPGTHWDSGENLSTVLRRFYDEHGFLPKSWDYNSKVTDPVTGEVSLTTKSKRLIETDFKMGFSQPVMWWPEKHAYVITGAAASGVMHPWQQRFLTHRELARIQGFPDDWKIWPIRNAPDVGPAWGKGVPVQTGRWVARWARASLEGQPGPDQGVSLKDYQPWIHDLYGDGRDEFVIDRSWDFRDIERASSEEPALASVA